MKQNPDDRERLLCKKFEINYLRKDYFTHVHLQPSGIWQVFCFLGTGMSERVHFPLKLFFFNFCWLILGFYSCVFTHGKIWLLTSVYVCVKLSPLPPTIFSALLLGSLPLLRRHLWSLYLLSSLYHWNSAEGTAEASHCKVPFWPMGTPVPLASEIYGGSAQKTILQEGYLQRTRHQEVPPQNLFLVLSKVLCMTGECQERNWAE